MGIRNSEIGLSDDVSKILGFFFGVLLHKQATRTKHFYGEYKSLHFSRLMQRNPPDFVFLQRHLFSELVCMPSCFTISSLEVAEFEFWTFAADPRDERMIWNFFLNRPNEFVYLILFTIISFSSSNSQFYESRILISPI